MKIKSDYILHSMGNEFVVVAVGERTEEFRGMIRLNATGAFLWERMQSECDEKTLAEALMAEYGITKKLAGEAVASFAAQLSAAKVLEL